MRLYQQWRDRRAARIARGSRAEFPHCARRRPWDARRPRAIAVETITLPIAPGRPGGRKFGRLVHDMLQHAGVAEEVESLAGIWGRRHGASEFERAAAVEVARAALAHPALAVPAGARRYRELPVMVRLDDGTLVDGRIDFAWSDGDIVDGHRLQDGSPREAQRRASAGLRPGICSAPRDSPSAASCWKCKHKTQYLRKVWKY